MCVVWLLCECELHVVYENDNDENARLQNIDDSQKSNGFQNGNFDLCAYDKQCCNIFAQVDCAVFFLCAG